MRGISDEKIKRIVEALKKADFAINTLERANQNKMLFATTKNEIQQLAIELTDRYLVKQVKFDKDE